MTHQLPSPSEIRMRLKDQSAQVEVLRSSLDSLIKQRENRSHFNQFAASYGGASWWKKLGFFILYSGVSTGAIYASGLPMLWVLPLLALYLIGIYFLSNHYQAHQTINTKTLEVLESILTESIDSIEQLRKQLSIVTEACSSLYQVEEQDQKALQEQIKALAHSNATYKKAVDTLEPIVPQVSESERVLYQRSQALLELLDEAHTLLSEEKREIAEALAPELDSTMCLLAASEVHMRSLERQLQGNVIQINTFVDELDKLLVHLETKGEVGRERQAVISETTKGIVERADDVLERAMQFVGRANKELDETGTSASNLPFFRHRDSSTRHTAISERFPFFPQ